MPFLGQIKPDPWGVDPSLVDPKWEYFHKHLRGAWGVFGRDAQSHNGALYRDVSRFKNHGTVDSSGGRITTTVLRGGKSLDYDGSATSDRVDLGSIPLGHPLSFGGEVYMTIVARCKWSASAFGNGQRRIFDKSNAGGPSDGYILSYNETTGVFTAACTNGGDATFTNHSFSYTLTAGEVFDIGFTAVWDGSTIIGFPCYFNGRPANMDAANGQTLTSFPSSTVPAAIGNWNHAADRMWGGEIEFVYVLGAEMPARFFKDIHDDPYGPFRPKPMVHGLVPVAAGAVMNQLQSGNLGADLYNGTIL